MSMKNSLTPAGLELATFRFVAQQDIIRSPHNFPLSDDRVVAVWMKCRCINSEEQITTAYPSGQCHNLNVRDTCKAL